MKALVLKGDQELVYTESHPIPEAPDERPSALVKVAACGICGSDIPRGFGGKAYFYPLVMGHEFSGIIEEPVEGGRFKKGDRVAVFPLIPKNMDTDPSNQTGNYASRVSTTTTARAATVPFRNIYGSPSGIYSKCQITSTCCMPP